MGFLKSTFNFVRHPYLPDSRGTWITLAILVPAFGVALLTWFWDALSDGESPSTTIRNIGLIIVAATAFPIAVWRGIVADKQATAAHSQAEVALRQDVTAQQGLRNERYQKGAEMLGSPCPVSPTWWHLRPTASSRGIYQGILRPDNEYVHCLRPTSGRR